MRIFLNISYYRPTRQWKTIPNNYSHNNLLTRVAFLLQVMRLNCPNEGSVPKGCNRKPYQGSAVRPTLEI